MRIAIDIRRMYEFGLATYIRNVVRTLGNIDSVNEYFLVGAAARFEQLGALPENFHLLPLQNPEATFATYLEMHRVIASKEVDLIHLPHVSWRPLMTNVPYVVTVHDLLDYMYRARTNNGMRRMLHSYMTRQVMHRAARIFAVSNFTKRDVGRYFNVKPEKIEVVYNALDETFLRGHSTAREQEMVRGRYQVDSPFLLYAGRISPHKNVARIIEAFSALKAELAKEGAFPDLKLIIIGDEVSKNPDIRRAVIRSGMQHDVRFLGYVSIDVLRIFFDMAKVFVFPSLYEGFGLPPLEAMAHGTPVVASNTSALPEVVGNAALLVNPENVFEISRALQRVLTDQCLRERMKAAGIEQAQRFSWEASVRRMLDVYEQVVAEHKKR
ncbi:MAG TPA: glycosyltransferase family 1 protein [Candidatus Saccharimonadales bacterium]|nr:glycosyltransferase family 1 protein [Candidatus Saccharimonadales bacterium]